MEINKTSPVFDISSSRKQNEPQNPGKKNQKDLNKNTDQNSFSEMLKKEIEKTSNK